MRKGNGWGAALLYCAPWSRKLFIDQRQEEVVAGLPSPKAAGEHVHAACHPTGVRLTDGAAQGVAATAAIVFFAIFISLLFITSQGNCYVIRFDSHNIFTIFGSR